MKITLYTPDGTAETFIDCEVRMGRVQCLTFAGTDWRGVRVDKSTTLQFTIDTTKDEVTEIFETSPLVQDNIPRPQ